MSRAFGDGWSSQDMSVEILQLDSKNPRLELPDNSTQVQIRNALLASEDVFDLIHKISTSGRMLAGERIIVTKEDGKFVVLEGNRRTTAAQILTNPKLLTKEQQKRLPAISDELKSRLSHMPVDIAPSRIAAEPILTKRHTERGAKPWSTLANMRRVVRYYEASHSVDEISSILSLSRARITQLLKGYKLVRVAQKASGWSADELKQLNDPKLVTSGFTRFFTLKDTRIKLDLNFDENFEPISGHRKDVLVPEIQKIARGFLIKDPETGKTKFDTRSETDEVLEGKPRNRAAKATNKSAAVTTPRASLFFEKIECKANDDGLIKLCHELKQVDHRNMPVAATMLLRSTLELALVYQIKKKNKWGEVLKDGKEKNQGKKDPTLSEIFRFCAIEQNSIFNEARVSSILNNQTARDAKDYLDTVTHGRWVEADPSRLQSIANSLRKVIMAIVEDTQ